MYGCTLRFKYHLRRLDLGKITELGRDLLGRLQISVFTEGDKELSSLKTFRHQGISLDFVRLLVANVFNFWLGLRSHSRMFSVSRLRGSMHLSKVKNLSSKLHQYALLVSLTAFLLGVASAQADLLSEEELQSPATRQLLRHLYGDKPAPEADDSSTTDSVQVEPLINPDFTEVPLFQIPELDLQFPDYSFSSSPEDAEGIEPVFDEFAQGAKTEYIRGALQNQRGYSSNALRFFITAVEKDPQNIWLKNRAAQAALEQNDFTTATDMAEKVLEADPKNITAMSTLAAIDYFREDIDGAKEWYGKILAEKPGNMNALESMARIAFVNEQDFEATKRYCSQIMEQTSRNLNAILWYAESNAITGDITGAADLYKQLVGARPSLINRLVDMANRLMREGRLDDAESLLRSGVQMLPGSPLAVRSWEELLEQRYGVEKITEEYEMLAVESPLDLKIRETYAEFLLRANRAEELWALREKMLEINPHHISSLLSLARLSLEKDDFPKAVEYFDHAIHSGPEDPGVFRDIGLVYLEYGKVEKARELLREAALLNPKDERTLLALGILAENEGKLEKAEATYKLALDAAPANRAVLNTLAQFYERQKDFYKASQMLEQLVAVDSSDLGNQLRLASVYLELGDAKALDRFESNVPFVINQKFNLFVDYALLTMEYGEFKRTEWALERALQISPAVLNLRGLMARTQVHLRNPEKGEEILKVAEAYFPKESEGELDYLIALIEFYLIAHQYEKAEATALQLLEKDSTELYHHTLYIDSLLDQKGRNEDIKKAVNTVVKEFSKEKPDEVKRVRAEVLNKSGDYARAAAILEPMLKDDPTSFSLQLELADTLGNKGDVKAAESIYLELIQKFEEEQNNRALSTVLNNLAYLYSEHEMKLDEAYAMARRADELAPRQDFILDTIGWIAYKQKNYEKAEEYLLKSYRLSLNDPEIASHLAILYEDQNKPELALEFYEKALRIEPKRTDWAEKVDSLKKVVSSAAAPPTPGATTN